MKHIITSIIFLTLLSSEAICQSQISEKIDMADYTHVVIANINGSVTASGTSAKFLELAAESHDYKKHPTPLGWRKYGDTLAIFLDSPIHDFHLQKNKWSFYEWNNDREFNPPHYEITIAIPRNIHLLVSTINEGDIEIEDFSTPVIAKNINGSIAILNAPVSEATTINGTVDIKLPKSPPVPAKLYSLNGDITVLTSGSLDADVTFSSHQGDFYTNLESHKVLPSALEIDKSSKGSTYSLKGSKIQFGQGGSEIICETFNGNVLIKK